MAAPMLLARRYVLNIALLIGGTLGDSREPLADTGLGAIKGKTIYSSSNSKPVYSFLGIPYAEVPSRFDAPVSLTAHWSGVKDAVEFKPHCMHNVRHGKARLSKLGLTYPHDTVSEDCLYLNVYTPSLPSLPQRRSTKDPLDDILYGSAPYPVIVYIHGGNFVMWSGSTVSPVALIAEQKVVVVTVNYRLGPFGFLCVGKAANVGLLDQIEALKWVQNNIQAFHGDPHRVTLMGFSAGAASVGLHVLSPLTRGLFQRAVMMGGSGLSVKAVTDHGNVAVAELMSAANCSGASSTPIATLACLRKTDAAFLANHHPRSLHDTWRPCVDGRVLPAHPQVLYRERRFNSGVQLMMGFTDLEAYAWLNDETDGDYDESAFNDTLLFYFGGARTFSDATVADLVSQARTAYIEGSSSRDDNEDDEDIDRAARRASTANVFRAAAMDVVSDYLVTAPMIKTAQLHSSMDADVYVYQFAYGASYHGRATGRPGYFASTHGDDALSALGLVYDHSFRLGPAADADRQLSLRFMSFVGCFARTGSPNSPTHLGHVWPRFLPDSRRYMRMGDAGNCHPYGLLKAGVQPFWDSYLFRVLNNATPDNSLPPASVGMTVASASADPRTQRRAPLPEHDGRRLAEHTPLVPGAGSARPPGGGIPTPDDSAQSSPAISVHSAAGRLPSQSVMAYDVSAADSGIAAPAGSASPEASDSSQRAAVAEPNHCSRASGLAETEQSAEHVQIHRDEL